MKQLMCIVLVLVSAAIINNVKSQQLTWQKTYGGSSLDHGTKCVSTNDGGFLFGGTSESADGDITAPYGNMDFWIVKITSYGSTAWQQSLGGSLNDELASVIQTSDGGYLMVGTTSSTDGMITNNHGSKDIWVVKMYSTGYINWQKCYGGSNDDMAFDVIEKSGHYIIVGSTKSTNYDATLNNNHNNTSVYGDGWIFQIDNAGNIEWNKFYGGSYTDYLYTIDLTSAGGFIVGGNTMSNDGEVLGSNGGFDAWILNLDASGNINWKYNYGGANEDYVKSIKEDINGNFIFGGHTNSSNSGNIGQSNGINDLWFVKLYNSGSVAFSKNYGGTDSDYIQAVDEDSNGYILLGYTYSNNIEFTSNYGSSDVLILKTDYSGNFTWSNNYGGSDIDIANSLIVLSDAEYIIAGETYSSDNDIDISGFHGVSDYWLFKLTNYSANLSSSDVTCFAGNNGWAAANPSGGAAPYYYNWSTTPPQTTDTIYNLTAGTYYVTITDINNNSAVDSVVISQPEQLNAIIFTTEPTCVGVNDGSIQFISPTGGSNYFQYSINGTSYYSTQSFNNIAVGTYNLYIRDQLDNSCIVQLGDSIVINPQVEVNVTLTPTDTITCSSEQIIITSSVSGGIPPITYEWNVLNNTNPFLYVSNGGIYSLRVKDKNGCIGFSKVEISDASPENILNNIDLTNGLIAYYPFTSDANDYSGNNYNGTVNGPFLTYDRFGYYNSAYYFDGVDDYISLPAFSGNDTTIGDFTASAWIYMYSQNPNNQSNNFRSTILDMRGDSTSGGKSFTFTLDSISGEPTEIHHVISWPSGGSIVYKDDMPTSPIGNWSFLTLKREGNMLNTYLDGVLQANEFSTGSTLKTDSLFLNCKGRIGATANDINRCFNGIIDDIRIYNRALSVDEILALYHEQRELAIVSNNYVCDGSSITLYLNNAQPNIKYSVKVNSTIRNFTQVWNGLNLRFTINSDSLIDGENSLQFIATDTILNCSIMLDTTFLLTKHTISVNLTASDSIMCNAASIQLNANVISGVSPLTYNWNILNASSTSAAVNSPGIYSVRVTDSIGCKGFASVEIQDASPVDLLNNVDLTSGMIAHYPLDNNANDVSGNSYNGTVNGAITATDRFGNANSAYKFDGDNDYIGLPSFVNNPTVADFTVSAWVYMDAQNVYGTNDRFRSSILDMRGDSTTTTNSFALEIDSVGGKSTNLHHVISWPTSGSTVYVDSIPSPVGHWEFITLRRQASTLNSFLNGSLRSNEFIFSSQDPKPDLLYLDNKGRIGSPSSYSLQRYFNGKIDDVRIYERALTNNEILALYLEGSLINVNLQDNALCTGANTSLTITNSQQNIKYQLVKSGGIAFGSSQTGNGGTLTFNIQSSDLDVGTNYVQILATDTTGLNCSITLDTTFTISVSSLNLNMTAVNVTCNGGNNGQASVSPSGGISPYTYLWNSIPPKTTQTISGLTPGFYSVTVTDNIGCTANSTVTITQPAALSLTITTQDATCGQNNGSATVSVTGGTTPYSYQWNNGVTTSTADSLVGGFYFVTVTDSKACSKFKMASINESGGPNILLNSISHVSCYNASTGSIDISVNNGTAPYEYEWSNGSLNQDLNGVLSGTYEVIVKDFNNCQSISSFNIYQPNDINIVTSTENSGCGVSNGTATAYVNGGTAPYTYIWNSNPVQNTQTATALASGSYSLTITDNNGCIKIKNTGIVVNSTNGPVLVTDSIVGTSCGSYDGAIYVTASGGTPPYQTIIWSNGNTSEDLSGVTNGAYSLTITDNNGCEGTISEEVPAIVPLDQQICIVSVDSATNKNLVAWEKLQTSGIDYYKVFREGNQAGVYSQIGTVPFDSISIFVDTTSKPKVRAYRYKISAVDLCGNESQLSTEHKTMHLTINVGINGTVNLIWDHYEGINFSSYLIYRYLMSTGWEMIDSMPNNLTSYTDYPSTTSGIAYKIAVDAPFVCDPAGLLNKTQTGPYSQSISNIDDYGIFVGSNLIYMENNISVYPNPFNDFTNIYFGNDKRELRKIEVLDLTGKIVFETNTRNNVVRLSKNQLNSGMYLIRISGKEVEYSKVIAN